MDKEIKHFTNSPEIQHFAVVKVSENDNVYGVTYGDIVRQYLLNEYSKCEKQTEVTSFGKTYKILARSEVTAFYDADGKSLFDVENTRLEKEYGYLTNGEAVPIGTASLEDIVTGNVPAPTEEEIAAAENEIKTDENVTKEVETVPEQVESVSETEQSVSEMSTEIEGAGEENAKSFQIRAKEKLEAELAKAKDKAFADSVIEYLLKRCKEDIGLAEDVCQAHKTWDKCFDYIYEQARKSAKGNRQCAVRNDVVFEWAEDYYHKDDKAEEEKKAKEKAEAAKKKEEQKTKAKAAKPNKSFEDSATKKAKAAAKENAVKTKPAEKAKKNSKDMEGQIDLFQLMEM